MRIFICEELINNLEANISKIQKIQPKIDADNCEAYFIYAFALFESALCEAMRHILNAFPEKLNNEKQLPLSANDIYNNIFSPQEIIRTIAENEIKKVSKGSAQTIVAEAESICAVRLSYENKRLDSISAIRNQITHENTPSRQVSNGKSRHGDENGISENYKNDISYLLIILTEFSFKIKEKYSQYTKYRMLTGLWNTLFDTPLLRFEHCVFIREGTMLDGERKVVGFYFDYIKKAATSISSSEKFFLSLLFQQYNPRINERFFNFSDIPMLVSISDKKKIYTFLHVMTLYPYLFNGMRVVSNEVCKITPIRMNQAADKKAS